MKTERVPFLAKLETLKPALATKDLIEELTHIWFDGNTATAYNDAELGIQVQLETDFKGGIRGALLQGLLGASRARELEFTPGNTGELILKAARTRANLAMLDLERSVWQFPQPGKGASFTVSDSFRASLEATLIAVGKDTTTPETLGITLYIDKSEVALFATDIATISATFLKPVTGMSQHEHIILPTAFCEQLLKMGSKPFLEINSDCAIAGNEETMIYARLHLSAQPKDFYSIINNHDQFPKGSKFPIPERLHLALDRMEVFLEGLPGEKMSVSIKDGKMLMLVQVQGRGELKDSVDVPADVPPVEFRVSPSLIKRGLKHVSSMVCREEAVRMTGPGGFLYLVSTSL